VACLLVACYLFSSLFPSDSHPYQNKVGTAFVNTPVEKLIKFIDNGTNFMQTVGSPNM
jgi:hypothetical protein